MAEHVRMYERRGRLIGRIRADGATTTTNITTAVVPAKYVKVNGTASLIASLCYSAVTSSRGKASLSGILGCYPDPGRRLSTLRCKLRRDVGRYLKRFAVIIAVYVKDDSIRRNDLHGCDAVCAPNACVEFESVRTEYHSYTCRKRSGISR